jgi:hypothetical protein
MIIVKRNRAPHVMPRVRANERDARSLIETFLYPAGLEIHTVARWLNCLARSRPLALKNSKRFLLATTTVVAFFS